MSFGEHMITAQVGGREVGLHMDEHTVRICSCDHPENSHLHDRVVDRVRRLVVGSCERWDRGPCPCEAFVHALDERRIWGHLRTAVPAPRTDGEAA